MPEELHAALERAIGLNSQAISLVGAQPESDGRAVLASALRENRDALVLAVAEVCGAVWGMAFAAGRAFEQAQPPVPAAPPELRLVAGG